MKITALRLARLRIPLLRPFRTALRSVHEVNDIVVCIDSDDGLSGYGGAAPTAVITGDTEGAIMAAIAQVLAPRLIGLALDDFNAVLDRVHGALPHNSSARAAVDMALHDLWARSLGAPLYRLLGGGPVRFSTDITISLGPIEDMLAATEAALAQGYQALKLKVGQDISLDLERVRALHAAVAGRARLRLDANQGWRAKAAIRAIGQLEDAGIDLDWVEQPVPAHDVAGLRQVTQAVHTPIMADESAFTARDVLALLQSRSVDWINIKLAKCGGIQHALKIADLCALHEVPCLMGCMLESPIGVAAAVHVAAARANVIRHLDLDAPALLARNPVQGGVQFLGPNIQLGPAAGIGIETIADLQFLETAT